MTKIKEESNVENVHKDDQKIKEINEKAKKIHDILEEDPKMFLQTFLIRSEFGDKPAVRLAHVPSNEETTETGEAPSAE